MNIKNAFVVITIFFLFFFMSSAHVLKRKKYKKYSDISENAVIKQLDDVKVQKMFTSTTMMIYHGI